MNLVLNNFDLILFPNDFSRLFIQITKRSSSNRLNEFNMVKERKNDKNN